MQPSVPRLALRLDSPQTPRGSVAPGASSPSLPVTSLLFIPSVSLFVVIAIVVFGICFSLVLIAYSLKNVCCCKQKMDTTAMIATLLHHTGVHAKAGRSSSGSGLHTPRSQQKQPQKQQQQHQQQEQPEGVGVLSARLRQSIQEYASNVLCYLCMSLAALLAFRICITKYSGINAVCPCTDMMTSELTRIGTSSKHCRYRLPHLLDSVSLALVIVAC